MIDADGRRYLDAYNNVPVVGHSHPRVVEALARQARTLNTNMRYVHEAAIELAERLLASMPADCGLDTVMFVNSGSEANDLAWRIATAFTGAGGGLSSEYAYHGISAVIADLSPEGSSAPMAANIERFPPPGADGSGPGGGYRAALERLAERGFAPAAVFVDGAFTSDGVFPPDPSYLEEILSLTHEAGGLYVADEVQVGHGRTGEDLWSFAASGIKPDMVTMGKPMGNGYPIAALVTRREIVDRFAQLREFFSTFGGNPPGTRDGADRPRRDRGRTTRRARKAGRGGAADRHRGARRRPCRDRRGARLGTADRRRAGRRGRLARSRPGRPGQERDARARRSDQHHGARTTTCSRSARRCPSTHATPIFSTRRSRRPSPPRSTSGRVRKFGQMPASGRARLRAHGGRPHAGWHVGGRRVRSGGSGRRRG